MIKLSLKWKDNQYYQRFRSINTSLCVLGGTRSCSITFDLHKHEETFQLWYILNARGEKSSFLIKFHRFLEKNIQEEKSSSTERGRWETNGRQMKRGD